jgi:hypothetical protein
MLALARTFDNSRAARLACDAEPALLSLLLSLALAVWALGAVVR